MKEKFCGIKHCIHVTQKSSETTSWGESERSTIAFDGGYKREYELEVHKASINNAYIKIIWEEQDKS